MAPPLHIRISQNTPGSHFRVGVLRRTFPRKSGPSLEIPVHTFVSRCFAELLQERLILVWRFQLTLSCRGASQNFSNKSGLVWSFWFTLSCRGASQNCSKSMKAQIEAWRLRLKPGGSDSSLDAQIQAWRFRFNPEGSDSSLEAKIEAWRLGLKPGGSD